MHRTVLYAIYLFASKLVRKAIKAESLDKAHNLQAQAIQA